MESLERTLLLLIISLAYPSFLYAENTLYTRVVDVGPGLCVITKTPNDHYFIYDAGHWRGGHCIRSVRDIIQGETIDLMILSHSDADHLGDASKILSEFHVKTLVKTGYRRMDSKTWKKMNVSASSSVADGTSVINLSSHQLSSGYEFNLGDTKITFVYGVSEWTNTSISSLSERRNAISIVVRLEHEGQSILMAGDTVGRHGGDSPDTCKHAEKDMVEHHGALLDADVLIAPHHGADNGSSNCFIEAVSPEFVIFSAGHNHKHPRKATAERYLNHLPKEIIFRTDLGDDEGHLEWAEGRIQGCSEVPGDDDIEIVLARGLSSVVRYKDDNNEIGCR